MLKSLARAIDGTVDEDNIVTERGMIFCTLVGTVFYSPIGGQTVSLGTVTDGVDALADAYHALQS